MLLAELIGQVPILICGLFLTIGGTWCYRSFAIKRDIVANPNFRSLHQHPMPCGGGVIVAFVFLILTICLMLFNKIDASPIFLVIFGGGVATVVGFIDDIVKIRAREKFLFQGGLAALILFCFGASPLLDLPWVPVAIDLTLSWVALVWLMNSFNFMDGIDGMAASGATFICIAASISLFLSEGDQHLIIVFALLAVCSFGFLFFNWPPASIFMGDAGSLFLGYCFGALIIKTVIEDQISLWTWLIIFGYFLADTTTTTVLRIFLVKRWYGAHRSHAYQNLARIWDSHLRVVLGVTYYHVLWLLPLTVWSVLFPTMAPLAALFAFAPSVFLSFRFGPRFSSS